MKTVLLIEIDHKKPLPQRVQITDIAGNRLYGYLYSQGVEAGVTVKLLDDVFTERTPEADA